MTAPAHKQASVAIAAAIIKNSRDEILITQRHPEKAHGGLWEFPGGKIETGESAAAAMIRELKEELAIEVIDLHQVDQFTHLYDSHPFEFSLFRILDYRGTPVGAEGQPLCWVPVNQLRNYNFPEANRAIIQGLMGEE